MWKNAGVYSAITIGTIAGAVWASLTLGIKLGVSYLVLGTFLAAIYRFPNLRVIEVIAAKAVVYYLRKAFTLSEAPEQSLRRQELGLLWTEMKASN